MSEELSLPSLILIFVPQAIAAAASLTRAQLSPMALKFSPVPWSGDRKDKTSQVSRILELGGYKKKTSSQITEE